MLEVYLTRFLTTTIQKPTHQFLSGSSTEVGRTEEGGRVECSFKEIDVPVISILDSVKRFEVPPT